MPTKPVPVQTHPVAINLPDGTQLFTTYNEAKEVHKVICDVHLATIHLTKSGHSANFFTHQQLQNCKKMKQTCQLIILRPKTVLVPKFCSLFHVRVWMWNGRAFWKHILTICICLLWLISTGSQLDSFMKRRRFTFQATKCIGRGGFIASTQSIIPCPSCWQILYSANFRHLADWRIECKEGMAWDCINSVQHHTLLDKTQKGNESLWTKVCEISDQHFFESTVEYFYLAWHCKSNHPYIAEQDQWIFGIGDITVFKWHCQSSQVAWSHT